jgi:SAM-dependent methyltransferase
MSACAACGQAESLVAHLSVGHGPGERGLIPTTDAYGTALEDLVRCTACGHAQLAAFPAEDELLDLYETAASEDYVAEEGGQRATAQVALDRIERFRPGRGRLLDLGCWVGFLLAEARERGWETVGVEPSAFAAAYARDRLGLDVRQEDLFAADLPAGSFDAVVLGDVIEHLIDPAAALDRIATLLAPGGVLYLALPDAGSLLARRLGRRWWSVIPTHVQYFTRGSLRALLERRGWTPLWIGTAPKTFTVAYYLGRLGGYQPALASALVRAARGAGIADRPWTPDFRDRMGVVARRPAH